MPVKAPWFLAKEEKANFYRNKKAAEEKMYSGSNPPKYAIYRGESMSINGPKDRKAINVLYRSTDGEIKEFSFGYRTLRNWFGSKKAVGLTLENAPAETQFTPGKETLLARVEKLMQPKSNNTLQAGTISTFDTYAPTQSKERIYDTVPPSRDDYLKKLSAQGYFVDNQMNRNDAEDFLKDSRIPYVIRPGSNPNQVALSFRKEDGSIGHSSYDCNGTSPTDKTKTLEDGIAGAQESAKQFFEQRTKPSHQDEIRNDVSHQVSSLINRFNAQSPIKNPNASDAEINSQLKNPGDFYLTQNLTPDEKQVHQSAVIVYVNKEKNLGRITLAYDKGDLVGYIQGGHKRTADDILKTMAQLRNTSSLAATNPSKPIIYSELSADKPPRPGGRS